MEPITTALAALGVVKQIVGLVKESCKTVDDVASLGPMLGKYFDKKQEFIKNFEEVKKSNFQGSNMAKSLEIELELDRMREFEQQVQMLFFQANKMDVWQKIIARAAAMDENSKIQKRIEKIALANRVRKSKERRELIFVLSVILGALSILSYGVYNAYYFCSTNVCGY